MENYILRIADKKMQYHPVKEGNSLEVIKAIESLDFELGIYKFFNYIGALPISSFLKKLSGEGFQARLYHCEKNEKLNEQEIKIIKSVANKKDRIVSVFRLEEIV